jgi:quinol monooxygenase YgiN
MILIEVALEPLPGREEALETLVLDTMRSSRAEPGCTTYLFTRDLENQRFHLIEEWADEAAIVAHLKGDAFRIFRTGLAAVGTVVSSRWRAGTLDPFQRPEV